MADVTIVETPESTPDESEETTWESALSEIRGVLESGFASLRASFSEELATLRESNSSLSAMVVSLTGQITDNNRTMLERLTAPPSTPEITVVAPIVETETPLDEEAASEEVRTEEVETPPPAQRKRRTL